MGGDWRTAAGEFVENWMAVTVAVDLDAVTVAVALDAVVAVALEPMAAAAMAFGATAVVMEEVAVDALVAAGRVAAADLVTRVAGGISPIFVLFASFPRRGRIVCWGEDNNESCVRTMIGGKECSDVITRITFTVSREEYQSEKR